MKPKNPQGHRDADTFVELMLKRDVDSAMSKSETLMAYVNWIRKYECHMPLTPKYYLELAIKKIGGFSRGNKYYCITLKE